MARDIANEIKVTLTPGEEAHFRSVSPVIPEAHEAYLKGRYSLNQRTEPGNSDPGS